MGKIVGVQRPRLYNAGNVINVTNNKNPANIK
jgi:hypothetical protein